MSQQSPTVLLIDNYDSFTYNLHHYLGQLGVECMVHRNDSLTVADALALKPDALVISPGPATPDTAGICLDLIDAAKETLPIFGVCLGHQSIGQTFGGSVIRANMPVHGKVHQMHHKNGGVFQGLPQPFAATRYHSLLVEQASLPDCLEVTAWSEGGEIMGLSHKSLPIHGVQFHPESIMTSWGHEIMANFLSLAGLPVAPLDPLALKTKSAA
ncbi:MAG: anthranilate synthase component II [Rhodospirillaceae bacterium]